MSLNARIGIGAVVGILLGLIFAYAGASSALARDGLYLCDLFSGFFVSLLKAMLVPLVFSSVVVGVSNLREHGQFRRVWLTTLICFSTTTCIAVVLGLAAARAFRPGFGLRLDYFQGSVPRLESNALTPSAYIANFVQGLFVNPFAALAQGNVLAIVVFAMVVGVAIVLGRDRYPTLHRAAEELFNLSMQVVGWIMYLAPLGILALLARLVATESAALFGSLAKFVAVVLGTTLFHGAVVLPAILFVFGRMSPWRFWRGARPALLTALATCSSSATMPVTLECLQGELKVESDIAGFVVPLGAQVNMDGTALYEAAAALFVANLAGIELNLGQQLVVCVTAMLASIGAPGIPSAGMVTMLMVLQAVGLPASAIAILLPLDRLLDTVRTMVNVEGDMVTSVIVQRIVNQRQPAGA